MKILAFDTTNATLSVAILFDKKLIAGKNILENNKHSEMLIPVIEECLKQAQIWYQNLDAIAFTNGPGSFTGIRVGLSCAKALAIATGLPVIAVNSLEAVAYSYAASCHSREGRNPEKILVVNDARLEEFFIQEFVIENTQLKPSFEPVMIKIDELENFLPKEQFILVGSAKNMIKNDLKNAIISAEEDFIDAKNIALLAEEKFLANHNYQSSALYIREPKISQRKVKNKS
jgi:tRNA threonylcarbamoyladenosine biosynthesis protein TsaB